MIFIHSLFNIYYEKYGNNKKKIIILPGWGDNRSTFNYIVNNLKEYFTVYIFDYPGFGNSPLPSKNLSIFDYAKVIHDFISEENLNNPIIIGHSFGGRLIILLASLYKQSFKKIILMDSAGIKNFSLKKVLKKYLYKLLKKMCFLFKNKTLYQKKLLQYFGSKDFQNINPIMQKTFINIVNTNLLQYINYISDETLILWGTNDTETPYSDALKMHELIKNSTLIPIDNSGHFPYLDYPYYIYCIIYEYLKDDIT